MRNFSTVLLHVTLVFIEFGNVPVSELDGSMNFIVRFVILVYQLTSGQSEDNLARKELFRRRRAIESIPPKADAMKQHILELQTSLDHQGEIFLQIPNPFPSELRTDEKTQSILRPLVGKHYSRCQMSAVRISTSSAKNDAERDANVVRLRR